MINKYLLSGLPIDLNQYKLGKIYQPKIIDFCNEDCELKNFIEPFYLEQVIIQKTPIFLKRPLTLLFVLDKEKSEENKTSIAVLLFNAIGLMYKVNLENISYMNNENGMHIVVKNDKKKVLALIDDNNFDILCQVVLKMTLTEIKSESEKKIYGSEEAKRKFAERRRQYAEKHKKDEIDYEITIFDMCNEVIHFQSNFDYEKILNWTIWQVKNTYRIANSMQIRDMLINSGSAQFDMKKVKMPKWKEQCKIKDIDLKNNER